MITFSLKKLFEKYFLLASILCAVLFSIATISCKKENGAQKQNVQAKTDSQEEGEITLAAVPSWHPSQKKICVVFGYGYNEKNYTQGIIATLEKKYGLDDGTPDSGLLFPLVYPDDFPSSRISRLPSLIGERELAGLIIIGAPENTNYALASLEDEWDTQEKMIPYPVYTFFPQDDVAGIEATSNFVVDRALEGSGNVESDETNKEEVLQTQILDLDKLLERAIDYMLLSGAPLPPDSDLLVHVKRIVGKNYKVSRYVDAESGLQSINHFVIEDAKK